MKILIVGAGALGGYFGARLLQAQQDITFLLRPGRVAQLQKTGLVVKSRHGDLKLPAPPHVLAADIAHPYDVVVVACKAYDLEQTMASFAPAVGPETMILPLLNGMHHIDQLGQRFGAGHVLGGVCLIAATLDADGAVRHLNDAHQLIFGERDGANSARVQALAAVFAQGAFDSAASTEIMQDMWEKWVFIAATAGITCLMRGSVGDILAGGGLDLTKTLLAECGSIARANGFAPRPSATARALTVLTEAGSVITASMLRDIENGAAIEADQIIGDLISRGHNKHQVAMSMLRVVYAHLKTYEARRIRELAAAPQPSQP